MPRARRVELGWDSQVDTPRCGRVALRDPCSRHLTSPLTVGSDLGKRWSAWR